MTTTEQSLPDLGAVAELVRSTAREELLPRFNRVGHTVKADGSILTEADLAVDRRLRRALASRWPHVDFLSEEMDSTVQRGLLADQSRPLWCLDPLDGTSNFAAGLPLFAVSLALLVGGQPHLAVTYDPVRDECFSAARDQGAWLHHGGVGQTLDTRRFDVPLARSVALVDLKRLPHDLAGRLVHRPPYGSQRNLGSCALEWAWLAAGRGHVYLHGGQKVWDLAAGILLLSEAGGQCETLEGETLCCRGTGTVSAVAALDPDLFRAWRAWLHEPAAGKARRSVS
ncbi:inositol monophosphatase [Thioalkalivibrio denitrificans]|uniref:Inositol monophosphatase n=1 Tax=Thioalkalivibrio denitrificans TaxID=108003 RepID=A0A1V3NUC9_9GAMM|nr:inositol monophosphatase family protein [Thioalkalivibrio denitrificans]OOG28725.1 inositol monophosphatase [Thioalkalivibrio denitrificans]